MSRGDFSFSLFIIDICIYTCRECNFKKIIPPCRWSVVGKQSVHGKEVYGWFPFTWPVAIRLQLKKDNYLYRSKIPQRLLQSASMVVISLFWSTSRHMKTISFVLFWTSIWSLSFSRLELELLFLSNWRVEWVGHLIERFSELFAWMRNLLKLSYLS